ncbi:hypothetical protein PIB30_013393 [Stylosanthes scabra]|uniref:Uncharacterized protein n=1 Tax=Stylosanthes scabra TaxID=79078 RepID=A0ABU6W4E3_9FABA|nr:hypothetical protein [Stylosanthes scabra]
MQRFPMFRFAYFILWTSIFVIFQWIIHACVSLWWPYPFLDLSSPYAPLWYFAVGVMHIPCYGAFALVVRLKHLWLSRTFPETSRAARVAHGTKAQSVDKQSQPQRCIGPKKKKKKEEESGRLVDPSHPSRHSFTSPLDLTTHTHLRRFGKSLDLQSPPSLNFSAISKLRF